MTPEIKINEPSPIRQAVSRDEIQQLQQDFQQLLAEKMRSAVRLTLTAIMNEELEAFVGAPYGEPSPTRRDYRNGYYQRDLVTSVGKIEDLNVPRTRGLSGGFRTQIFEQYQRRQRELDIAIGEMFVKGISTAGVGHVMETLTGEAVSPSTVSRIYHSLEGEYAQWQQRELPERYVYVFADGTYFSVIYGDDQNGREAHKTPILALIGITPAGKREVIAFTIGERENQGAWENLLDDLKTRGVKQVDLWITDGHQAMLNAIALQFPDSQRQRCMRNVPVGVHKLKNVLSHVPEKQRAGVEAEFKAIFYQDNRARADQCAAAFREKYRAQFPTAIACMDRDWEACLTFYAFPPSHWARIRTTNVIERMFEEVKKRSKKMAAAFRNAERPFGKNSCLLLFYAVVRGLTFQNVVMQPDLPAR